jgi:hypothetical protein
MKSIKLLPAFTPMAVALTLSMPAKAATAEDCAAIMAMPVFQSAEQICTATSQGIFIGKPSASASTIKAIDEAETRFSNAFAPPVQPIAVVSGGQLSSEKIEALRVKGFATLPWLDGEMKRAKLEAAIRAQVAAQAAHMPEAAREAAIQQALAKIPGTPQDAIAQDKESGAIAHEIAHIWFRLYFDGVEARPANHPRRYGSSSADWLDEIAAVLAENEVLTNSRRGAFSKLANPLPLEKLFTMEHPLLKATKDIASDVAAQGAGATVRILSGADAAALLQKSDGGVSAPDFYAQARAFADFMIEQSGDPKIFLKIADAQKKGDTMEAWLAANGRKLGLASSVQALEADWQKWIQAKRVSP